MKPGPGLSFSWKRALGVRNRDAIGLENSLVMGSFTFVFAPKSSKNCHSLDNFI